MTVDAEGNMNIIYQPELLQHWNRENPESKTPQQRPDDRPHDVPVNPSPDFRGLEGLWVKVGMMQGPHRIHVSL